MKETRTPPATSPVSEAVQEQIHFDTLWSTAQDALAVYSGQRWSAQGEGDPGVTLMQAFAYGVSDVSYRHTLPLVDLLTEESVPKAEGDHMLAHTGGIFADEFGPEWALTSSPVTLEDYRRGILDLTVVSSEVEWGAQPVFCFRDVQIALRSGEESYAYTCDTNRYAFQFVSPKTPTTSRYRVPGSYHLWVTLHPEVSWTKAKPVLEAYLKDHRNLCEWEMLPEAPVTMAIKMPEIKLTLTDDLPVGEATYQAVAQALWTVNQTLLPLPERRRAADRLADGEPAEKVYNGPHLNHGWITTMPPVRAMHGGVLSAYEVPVQALTAAVLGRVSGIQAMDWSDTDTPMIVVPAGQQVQLWVDIHAAENVDLKLQKEKACIQVYKRGQRVALSDEEWKQVHDIYQRLKQAALLATPDDVRSVKYGRYRHPGFYRSVGASLPPVYGLQQAPEVFGPGGDAHARNLMLFLRPFEQQLANHAEQLQKLPRLLAFDGRDTASTVWGHPDWPQSNDDALAAQQTAKLIDPPSWSQLQAMNIQLARDPEKELSLLNYLLGYFGEHRAGRGLTGQDIAAFVAVQQGFLRQVTRLAYARAAISISKISALQRKIAARLGVGPALFSESLQKTQAPFPAGTLPFYVIEHQELLPVAPTPEQVQTDPAVWPEAQAVTFKQVDEQKMLQLTLTNAKGMGLVGGQLIELRGVNKKVSETSDSVPLMAIVLHSVDGDIVSIDLTEHARLERSLAQIKSADYAWTWRLAQTWLKRSVYNVVFADGRVPKDTDNTVTLSVPSGYPVELKVRDRFALRPHGRWQSWPTKDDLASTKDLSDVVVEVTATDAVRGTVTVKWVAACKATLHIETPPYSVDAVNLTVDAQSPVNWDVVTQPGNQSSSVSFAWSLPYRRESFSFSLSVVLDRAWLAGGEPEVLNQWIEHIVREEMPSHLNLQLHWLGDYANFANRYRTWQESGRPVGDQSYELLRLLGIGERPVDMRSGIGFVRVATEKESQMAEQKVNAKPAANVDILLQKEALVYVRGKGFRAGDVP
ncbi:hypothetical protein K7R09_24155 [Serratia ureilytica]|uniref:Baseplate protein J-like domain-containing protein n=1 Tax=Serratia ureilytica TaxID=300181 RepID=A0ABU0VQZ2_9GAMM|nr:hypothetical protein [Serratia ureilytica]MCU7064898.1 hypothetical protein [Serratia ureilytica]MDQ1811422.1 hypothetical protein [Serratia ureilytica]MDQ1840379.1 hypothetical protein [Serratia ureilytica]MDQ1863861.1 hypothetical protein [Serratia ureilytica]